MIRLLMLAVVATLGWGCAKQEPPTRWRVIALSDSRIVAREPRDTSALTQLAERVTRQAVEERGQRFVSHEETWLTIIDARDPRDPRIGSWQGDVSVYPASIVKVPYMVTAYDMIATGKLEMTKALYADLDAMINVSSNVATNRILDLISNTGFGPNLSPDAMESFVQKRQIISRHMRQLGLQDIYAANKTFEQGIPFYGRDEMALGARSGDNYENSNMMTTADTARLLYLIRERAVVSPEACDEMMKHMRRGPKRDGTYFSKIVPEGVSLYSKSGAAGPARHDAGIFELPDGGAIIVVAFSKQRIPRGTRLEDGPPQVIERVAELVLEELRKSSGELDNATRDRVPGQSL